MMQRKQHAVKQTHIHAHTIFLCADSDDYFLVWLMLVLIIQFGYIFENETENQEHIISPNLKHSSEIIQTTDTKHEGVSHEVTEKNSHSTERGWIAFHRNQWEKHVMCFTIIIFIFTPV